MFKFKSKFKPRSFVIGLFAAILMVFGAFAPTIARGASGAVLTGPDDQGGYTLAVPAVVPSDAVNPVVTETLFIDSTPIFTTDPLSAGETYLFTFTVSPGTTVFVKVVARVDDAGYPYSDNPEWPTREMVLYSANITTPPAVTKIAIPSAPPIVDDPTMEGDAHYDVPASDDQVTWTPNSDGSVTVTTKTGYEFTDGTTSKTYPAPVDKYTPPATDGTGSDKGSGSSDNSDTDNGSSSSTGDATDGSGRDSDVDDGSSADDSDQGSDNDTDATDGSDSSDAKSDQGSDSTSSGVVTPKPGHSGAGDGSIGGGYGLIGLIAAALAGLGIFVRRFRRA